MHHQNLRSSSRSPQISRRLKNHPAESYNDSVSPEGHQSEKDPGNEKKKPVRINYIVRDLPLY